MKNKILIILLVMALIMVLAMPTAFADDSVINADVDESYTITIPATVDFGVILKNTGTETQPFVVEASDVFIRYDESVHVHFTGCASDDSATRSGTWLMHDANEPEWDIPYTLNNSTSLVGIGDEFASFTADGTESGHVDADTSYIDYPGSYSDTMTFTISCS